jgi:dsRNA-specific ribonuclease
MSLIISQSISDADKLILNNDITNINGWVQGALDGKINNCYKRMKTEWVPKLMDDPNISAISASRDEFVQQVLTHPSYQNRETRDSGSLDI